jgi:hypothetical protein
MKEWATPLKWTVLILPIWPLGPLILLLMLLGRLRGLQLPLAPLGPLVLLPVVPVPTMLLSPLQLRLRLRLRQRLPRPLLQERMLLRLQPLLMLLPPPPPLLLLWRLLLLSKRLRTEMLHHPSEQCEVTAVRAWRACVVVLATLQATHHIRYSFCSQLLWFSRVFRPAKCPWRTALTMS